MRPAWLNKKIYLKDCAQLKALLKAKDIHTVCEEAMCPNIGECFARRQATFLILGEVCTRGCRFCGIKKGVPLPPDPLEAQRVADCVKELNLSHVVVTSVTRDDLTDAGALLFAQTVNAIRDSSPGTKIEVLIPDFNADKNNLRVLTDSKPDIIAHNLETVPRLYKYVRKGASYEKSLNVFSVIKTLCGIPLKSGLMLGLGEKEDEVLKVFDDLVKAGCIYLSIGQYLSPSRAHFPVKEYIHPQIFDLYRERAIAAGFRSVKSAPYVRSSYMAHDYK